MIYLFQRNALCLYYPLPHTPSHSRLVTQLSGGSQQKRPTTWEDEPELPLLLCFKTSTVSYMSMFQSVGEREKEMIQCNVKIVELILLIHRYFVLNVVYLCTGSHNKT